jgi:V-type H+-transporting ATPase subunit a
VLIYRYLQLNPEVNAFQRIFVRDIRRFDELERKLRYLGAQIKKEGLAEPEQRDDGRHYEVLQPHEVNQLEVSNVVEMAKEEDRQRSTISRGTCKA